MITNRTIDEKRNGIDKFGRQPDPSGPNEMRLLTVDRDGTVLGGDDAERLLDCHVDLNVYRS